MIAAALAKPRETRYADGADYWYRPYGRLSSSGMTVSEHTMLSTAAVLQAVRLKAESIAMMPCILRERVQEPGEQVQVRDAVNHPLYRTLRFRPNPLLSAFEFFRMVSAQIDLRGNFYAHIVPTRGGGVQFWPLQYDRVKPRIVGDDLVYDYTPPNATDTIAITSTEMLHIRGFHPDGLIGRGLNDYGVDAIGKMKSAEQYGASVFKNGSTPGGILKFPTRVKDEDRASIRAAWNEMHEGAANAHKIALLDNGAEWVATGITPRDAQMIETQTFQLLEVARLTNTPPHLLMQLKDSGAVNIEHLAIQWITFSLQPLLDNIAQRLAITLLPRADWTRYNFYFDTTALVRADTKTQYEALRVATGTPFMSPNEAREVLSLSPVEGGDTVYIPLNMSDPGGDPAMRPDDPIPAAAPVQPIAPPTDGDPSSDMTEENADG